MTSPTPVTAISDSPAPALEEVCEYCGLAQLVWRKCKQLCTNCGGINRSCADL